MLSCARATRGLRRPSLDTRSGRPSNPPSRKRWNSGGCSMRAVKDSLTEGKAGEKYLQWVDG